MIAKIEDIVSQKKIKILTLALAFIVVCIFAWVNPLGVTPDHAAYIAFFDWALVQKFTAVLTHKFEPAFSALSWAIVKMTKSTSLTFLAMVLLASGIKLLLFYKIASPLAFLLVTLLFFFKVFPLHEYNQLRAAFAIGFLLLSYYYLVKKENYIVAAVCAVHAVGFHYSSLVILPFIAIARFDLILYRKYISAASFFIIVLLYIFSNLLVYEFIKFIPRMSYVLVYVGPAVNQPLSPVFFPEFFLMIFSLFLWSELTDNMKRVVALQLVGFAIFYGLYNYGVIGTRLREIVSVFWLFYLVDYHRVHVVLRIAILVFILMNIVLGSYLFYFSDYLK